MGRGHRLKGREIARSIGIYPRTQVICDADSTEHFRHISRLGVNVPVRNWTRRPAMPVYLLHRTAEHQRNPHGYHAALVEAADPASAPAAAAGTGLRQRLHPVVLADVDILRLVLRHRHVQQLARLGQVLGTSATRSAIRSMFVRSACIRPAR